MFCAEKYSCLSCAFSLWELQILARTFYIHEIEWEPVRAPLWLACGQSSLTRKFFRRGNSKQGSLPTVDVFFNKDGSFFRSQR